VWGLLVVAVLVLAAVIWHRQVVRADIEFANEYNAWVAGADSRTGDEADVIRHCTNIIEKDKNTSRAASAAYGLGNYYYGKYLAGTEQTDQAKFAAQAKQTYSIVVTRFPQERIFLAKAHFALGKLAESQGNFNLAETEYNAVQSMIDLSNVPVVEYATEAIKTLPSLKTPVVFATTKPATAPDGPASRSSLAPAAD
jgi:hypothetical protein